MRRRFEPQQNISPEKLREREEDKKRAKEEREKADAEYRKMKEEILQALESSPVIKKVKEYIKTNPIPQFQPPLRPDKKPFPPAPILPKYNRVPTNQQPEKPGEEFIEAYWVCSNCGEKIVASEHKLHEVISDDGEDSGLVMGIFNYEKPVGQVMNAREDGTIVMAAEHGSLLPESCCYRKAVEDYKKACRLVSEKNAEASVDWQKLAIQEQGEHHDKIRNWYESTPEYVKFIFPEGYPRTHIAKWITGEKSVDDPMFQEYALKELRELEKIGI